MYQFYPPYWKTFKTKQCVIFFLGGGEVIICLCDKNVLNPVNPHNLKAFKAKLCLNLCMCLPTSSYLKGTVCEGGKILFWNRAYTL